MRLFPRRGARPASSTPAPDPILDAPISIGEMPRTTLRELRHHADNIATRDARNTVEQGLAVTILYLIDELVAERVHATATPTLSQEPPA